MTATAQHVLVVEDDADIRQTLVELLDEAGYVVAAISDGKPALTRLHTSKERLVVLLDLNMPGMSGKAVLEAVANHETLPLRHTYILVTANERTLPLAFVKFLTQLRVSVIPKPFDIDRLLEIVAHSATRLTAEN